jgi:hypothetical protein
MVGTRAERFDEPNEMIYERHRAHKMVRDNRTAKDRTFGEGDIVYLFNPARKSQLSRKFRAVWTGPYRITRRTEPLNYQIESQKGVEQVIHVNRLKLANNPGIWERKIKRKTPRRNPRRQTQSDDSE